jgi:hypothetical protein
MTYNRKGELVELDKVISDTKTEKRPVKLVEKSNIFKTTAFVTESKFKGNKTKSKSGSATKKKNFTMTRVPPSRGNLVTKIQPHPTKTSTIHRSTTFPTTSTTTTTTTPLPPPFTAIIFSDDFSSTENSLHNTYDDIKTDFQHYSPVTERPQSLESTIFVYSTPSPTTLSSIIVKKTKKKKKKKVTTTPIPVHEHIIQNLDYYRKLLGLNCTKAEAEKQAASEQVIVSITPKPSIKIKMHGNLVKKVQAEDSSNDSSEEGKNDKKKHCKKKHGHHSHEHNHHHKVG